MGRVGPTLWGPGPTAAETSNCTTGSASFRLPHMNQPMQAGTTRPDERRHARGTERRAEL